ncbi:sugar phosphate nucleotidyltransferase [Conexibacter woesei]|uniref:Nucleotidyl transferase n=1 Tax=Conexibacter woesei (strain DSM 14684 / CCUG 47730 / CIP 108061 / JCM 11494 / NBRC 100937 / ID131577) TaxID=469383 RepID=D3F931_CONWI|nr:NDP-sugar synthase [Conexibacter woesei]ADB53026.1 Nucleotidyl transferase [Conexibacter woesei DSM 14684]
MQALILAGGEGTRLRPLTSTVPKPVVPLVDRPFIAFMLDWLRRHGVDDVVISCGFMASGVRNVLGDGSAFGIRLRYVEEPRPLGTGGAIKFAEPLLDERVLVLNGDVLTDIDLTAQLAQHERTGARVTLALIAVDDPSAYGLVRRDEDGGVREFLEKPSPDQIDTNLVNAGAYVLEREVLDAIPTERAVSVEREVFPTLVRNGLYGYEASGYWLDIGTPERYLQASHDILDGAVETSVPEAFDSRNVAIADSAEVQGRVVGPALVGPGVRIAAGALVSGRTVLGRGVEIGEGAHIDGAVVLDGAVVGPHTTVSHAILGPGAQLGAHCRVDGGVVLGEGVVLGAENHLTAGARLFPNVSLPDGAIKF